MRLASSATAWWSGPITTASAALLSFGAAARTWASSDCPATGCRTLGVADRMRVPSPAASTMVRLVLLVIRILAVAANGVAVVIKRFRPAWKHGFAPLKRREQDQGRFPV